MSSKESEVDVRAVSGSNIDIITENRNTNIQNIEKLLPDYLW